MPGGSQKRKLRLAAIRRLVAAHAVTDQEELLGLLRRHGHPVTQATLSRDLTYLKVVRIATAEDGYVYGFAGPASQSGSRRRLVDELASSMEGLEVSGNLCVIHTAVGHAGSVALALDKLGLPGLLGTVAGDDTIIGVLQEGTGASQLRGALAALVPEMEGMFA